MDYVTFEDFIGNITTDTEISIINKFDEYGITLRPGHIPEDISKTLDNILNIITIPKKVSLRHAKISGNTVSIGSRTFKLPAALSMPENVVDKESTYVDALLEVYSQAEHITKIELDDLIKMPLEYQQHFRIQRESFYSAESVLHQIRDTFNDGEVEFNNFKDETLAGIIDEVIKKQKNAYERVKYVLHIVISVQYSKSLLSRPGNGLIGLREKKGIVHMLVNDGVIQWVKDYDEDI